MAWQEGIDYHKGVNTFILIIPEAIAYPQIKQGSDFLATHKEYAMTVTIKETTIKG